MHFRNELQKANEVLEQPIVVSSDIDEIEKKTFFRDFWCGLS